MKLSRKFLPYGTIGLASIIFCYDLFACQGQPVNMDGTTHLVNMATFYRALSQGDFPVGWIDGYANYGLPMGYFAQQVTSYLGAWLTFLTRDVVVSFKLTYLVGTILSGIFFYEWVRLFVGFTPAMTGTLFFMYAPYRILNTYIRGALPEYFGTVFIGLILLCQAKQALSGERKWFFVQAFAWSGLILTHPMNVVTGSWLIVPLGCWYVLRSKNKIRLLWQYLAAVGLGAAGSGYYLIPLLKEIKYFYYSQATSHFTPNSFIGLSQIIQEKWPFYSIEFNNILSRGHIVQTGQLEILILAAGLVWLGLGWIKREGKLNKMPLGILLLVGWTALFMTTKASEWIYLNSSLMSNIQFPWRMLTAFQFIPPTVLALMLANQNVGLGWSLGLICLLLVYRYPQLYTKSVAVYELGSYEKTWDNPHEILMNPIWTGPAKDYPVKEYHGEIIEGEGRIISRKEENSAREYAIIADSEVRLSDNTFYFPGWKVWVDGMEVDIEFQDPSYRGVITYQIGPGEHEVLVKFVDTKWRVLGKLISIGTLGGSVGWMIFLSHRRYEV